MGYSKSKVTIIIPAKDEAAGLRKIIRSVKPYANQVIIVDGHSTDDTEKITREEKVDYILDNGLGKGDAVRLGIQAAKGNILVFFDADGSHEVSDIPKLVAPLFGLQADLVIASRRTGGSFDLNPDFAGILRSGGADFLVYLVNKRFKTNLSDILYSFRAIRKSTAKNLHLTSDGFTIEQEMIVSCLKLGYKLLQIPSREKKRAWGKSKLHTITGISLLWHLIKQLYFRS